jgi:transcription elongation factor GreA
MSNPNVTYVSASGLVDMKAELIDRIKNIRPVITTKIGDAKELGDISENFEYHDAKEQQAQNEMRIVDLTHMISTAVIVDDKIGGMVGLGSKFTVKAGSIERAYQMVGENEANPMEAKISNLSPLGAAFMNRSLGDKVEVTTPTGVVAYEIVAIA